MIIDLAEVGPEYEAAHDVDAAAYGRNTRWALADFECPHGKFEEDCEECQ